MYQATLFVTPMRPDATMAAFTERLVHNLREASGRSIAADGNTVRFTGGMFRWVTNWNVLVPITRGEVRIDQDMAMVQYGLTFTQVAIVMPVSIGFVLVMAALHDSPVSTGGLVAWFLMFSFGGVAASVAIGIRRFDDLLRRCLRDAGFSVAAAKKGVWSRESKRRGTPS